MLSVKQGSYEYQFLSHWFDPTLSQTRVYSSRDRRSIPLGHLSCYVALLVWGSAFGVGIRAGQITQLATAATSFWSFVAHALTLEQGPRHSSHVWAQSTILRVH